MKQLANFLKIMMFVAVGIVILLPINTIARDNSLQDLGAKWVTRTLSDVKISGIHEDSLFIDQKKYLFTYRTIFLKKSQKKEMKISDEELTFPSRARITYRVYTVPDEGHPFRKDQKVLTKVLIY